MSLAIQAPLRERYHDDKLANAIIEGLVHHCHLFVLREEVTDWSTLTLEAKQLIPVLDFYLAKYCIS